MTLQALFTRTYASPSVGQTFKSDVVMSGVRLKSLTYDQVTSSFAWLTPLRAFTKGPTLSRHVSTANLCQLGWKSNDGLE
jgi:hypothetical protein